MNTPLQLLASLVLLLALAACNREGPAVPTPVEDGAANKEVGDGIQTVVVDPNAAFVGTAVDSVGNLLSPQNEFSVGDTVFVSIPSKGRRLGSRVEVFWFHEDGISRKDDAKTISGPFTFFEFPPTEPGRYNVEVSVDTKTVALVEFLVR